MNRQQILVTVLALVAVTMLPSYFADRAGARLEKEMVTMEREMEVLRARALKAREEEERLAVRQRAMTHLEARLLTRDPFAGMEREVTGVAARAGLQVLELNLLGAEPVQELPTLVRYTAAVEVAGTTGSLIEFVRLLEQHPLLIEVPDLKLVLPRTAPGASQTLGSIRTRLTLYFFGEAAGQ